MSLIKREKLVKSIYELGFNNQGHTIVAVTLNEFFDGNEDEASLGCNLVPHPSLEALYYHLQRFSNEHEVEVYVEIHEVDESDDERWPYSERVYLIGDVDTDTLKELSANVFASQVEKLGDVEINGEIYNDVNALWWD